LVTKANGFHERRKLIYPINTRTTLTSTGFAYSGQRDQRSLLTHSISHIRTLNQQRHELILHCLKLLAIASSNITPILSLLNELYNLVNCSRSKPGVRSLSCKIVQGLSRDCMSDHPTFIREKSPPPPTTPLPFSPSKENSPKLIDRSVGLGRKKMCFENRHSHFTAEVGNIPKVQSNLC
jgi:hypothetical protein